MVINKRYHLLFNNAKLIRHSIILITIIIFLIQQDLTAQDTSKFDFFLGYGYYEGFNIGGEYHFKSDEQLLGLSIGYNGLWSQKNEALTLEYDYALFRNHKINSKEFE